MKKGLAIIGFGVGVIVLPALVNVVVSHSTPLAQGSYGDWIAFYGSYLGAVLGGVIAFTVAKVQIDANNERERLLRTQQQLPTLCELLYEIGKAEEYLQNKAGMAETQEALKAQLKRDTGQDFEPLLGTFAKHSINEPAWYRLDRIVDPALAADVIEFREAYLKLMDVLSVDLAKIEIAIGERRAKLERIDKPRGSENGGALEKQRAMIEHADLNLALSVARNEKEEAWERIRQGWYSDNLSNLRKGLESARDKASAGLSIRK